MPDSSPAPTGRSFVGRIKGILVDPRSEWPIIAAEPATTASIYLYVLPLAAIPAVCHAIGLLGIGGGLPDFGAVRFSPMWAVRSSVRLYIESLAAVYIVALVISLLAPLFGGERNRMEALKVAAYSSTAVFVAGVFAVIPGMRIAQFARIVGLGFSLYLVYLGLPVAMKTPEAQAQSYAVATVVVLAVVFSVIIVVANQYSGWL